jgi:ubiquinone/menaquinone biosynthesis C-methylase UbiE
MINLTEKNVREKEFHDKLQSSSSGRFENIFYKAIINAWEDFYNYLSFNVKNTDVLDYGCGVGPVIEKVLKFNPNKITGIDISKVSIEKAKVKFVKFGSNVEFLVDNCEKTKFEDNKFDLVYGQGILHHLEISSCIFEISRILKPGGKLLFIEPLGTNPLINLYRRLTLIFFPLYKSGSSRIFKVLTKLDQLLFKFKLFKYFAWSVLITATKN